MCIRDSYIVASITGSTGNGIYRCKLDGSGMAKVFDAQAYRICTVGDMIYFINQSDEMCIRDRACTICKS